MFLKKVHEEHTKKVAKLVTHCRPGLRLDFMVSIYDPDELQHMGGELGLLGGLEHFLVWNHPN